MILNRRNFLTQLSLAAATLAVDPEKLFWEKKKSIFIPAAPSIIGGIEPTTWVWKQYTVPIVFTLKDLTQCEQEAAIYFLGQKKKQEALKNLNKFFERYPVQEYGIT